MSSQYIKKIRLHRILQSKKSATKAIRVLRHTIEKKNSRNNLPSRRSYMSLRTAQLDSIRYQGLPDRYIPRSEDPLVKLDDLESTRRMRSYVRERGVLANSGAGIVSSSASPERAHPSRTVYILGLISRLLEFSSRLLHRARRWRSCTIFLPMQFHLTPKTLSLRRRDTKTFLVKAMILGRWKP